MKIRNRRFTWVAALAVLALVFAGCSKGPEDEAQAGEKSPGLFSRLTGSSTPVTIPAGTPITVTLDQSLASNQQTSGDEFDASVAAPVIVNGKTVIPKGAAVIGRVVEARESGRLKGVAELRLTLASVEVDGDSYDVESSSITRTGGDHKKRNTALIGGGAAAGAVIGGLAGGGKGALIGGAAGAGAGTATAAATGKKDITIPAETRLSFKLSEPLTIQVKN